MALKPMQRGQRASKSADFSPQRQSLPIFNVAD